jgi:hypothetical protein
MPLAGAADYASPAVRTPGVINSQASIERNQEPEQEPIEHIENGAIKHNKQA